MGPFANGDKLNLHLDYGMDKLLLPRKQWGVITHPYPNLNV